MKYKVYGDYGYTTETLLNEFESRNEAVCWAQDYTSTDCGGYDVIEVAYFEGEEYVTVWTFTALEDDYQPTEMEEWLSYDQDC